jgi:hypothetical protein
MQLSACLVVIRRTAPWWYASGLLTLEVVVSDKYVL